MQSDSASGRKKRNVRQKKRNEPCGKRRRLGIRHDPSRREKIRIWRVWFPARKNRFLTEPFERSAGLIVGWYFFPHFHTSLYR